MDKEVLESTNEWIHEHKFMFKIKIMCFHFFYTAQEDTVYQKVLHNPCLFLFLRHGIQKTKEHILCKWGFIVFYSKK